MDFIRAIVRPNPVHERLREMEKRQDEFARDARRIQERTDVLRRLVREMRDMYDWEREAK